MEHLFEVLARSSDDQERRRILKEHPELRSSGNVRALLNRAAGAPGGDAAGPVLDAALTLARTLDPADQAEALLAVAHLLFRRARYAEAEDLYAEAGGLAAARGQADAEFEACLRRIDCLGARGQARAGLALAEQLEPRLAGRDRDLALLWTARGHLHLSASRFAEALASYEAAAQVHGATGDTRRLAEVDLRRATALTRLGRFREAEPLFRTVKAYFQGDEPAAVLPAEGAAGQACETPGAAGATGGGPAGGGRAEGPSRRTMAAVAASNLGVLAYYLGRYGEALSEYEEAREGFARAGSEAQRAMVSDNIAETYLELNLLAESHDLAEEAAGTFQRLNLPGHRARAELNQARALLRERPQRLEAALELLRRARETLTAQGDPVWTHLAGLDLAGALLPSDPAEALRLADEARPFFRGAGLDHYETYARWVRAEALLAAERGPEAAQEFERLVTRAENLNLSDLAARCRLRLGRLAELRGDRARARQEYDRALVWVETTRASLKADDFRAAFIEDKQAAFARSVELTLAAVEAGESTPDELLLRVERWKARILLDYLAAGEQKRTAPGSPAETPAAGGAGATAATRALDERRGALREELALLHRRIRDTAAGAAGRETREAARREATRHEREYVDLTRRLRTLTGRVGLERVPEDLATRLKEALEPDTALIDYFELDDDLVALTVYRGRLEAHRLAGAATAARALLADFEDEVLGDMSGLDAEEAGSALVGALARRAERVLVGLHHALLGPLELAVARARRLIIVPHGPLHFVPFAALLSPAGALIDRCELTVLPSAATRVALPGAAGRPAPGRPLIVGGPADDLPWLREELADVAARLGQPTVVTAGQEADLPRLLAAAPLVHFAGHALLRRDNPVFSYLETPRGRLTLGDILELRLSADLVVLAGCETGAGLSRPGDELLGLARAFLHAGARALVASLWPVDDRATRRLMGLFYGHLARVEPAAALRLAQQELRRDLPHPYYWAGFVHVGATETAGRRG